MPSGAKAEDLTGRRFHRLTAVERAPNIGPHTAWKCICKCGNWTTVRSYALKSGNTKSCGCLTSERMKRYHIEKKLMTSKW